jgi:hypothetical protein
MIRSAKGLLFLVSCVACLGLISCSEESDSKPVNPDPVTGGSMTGIWDNGAFRIVIADSGAYDGYVSGAPSVKVVWGTMIRSGNTVSITDTGGSYGCSVAVVGDYSVVVTDTTLDFTNINDTCQGRIDGLDAVFTRE